MKHDAHTEARAIGRTAQHTALALACVALALIILAAAVVFYAVRSRPEWFAPLGPYPVQQVTLPMENGYPTLHLSADPIIVPVAGRKCAEGSDYTVSGTVSWQSMQPPGTIIRTGTGTREGHDGCLEFRYVNIVPRSVETAMRAQLRAGLRRPLWRITGIETPLRRGEEGVPVTWVTDTFAVEP